jgi:TRAP transporter TAXI family solute receptor
MNPFPPRVCQPALLLLLLTCAGCARGADESRLRTDLQARLDREVKADLFEVKGLRREGSAPMPAGESGRPRVVVYFNTTLELEQDYEFGGWDQLGASSLAYALGATEKGLFGLQPHNRAGEVIRSYGSAIYEESDDGWTLVAGPAAATASGPPNIEGSAPPTRSKQLIDQLAARVNLPPPGVPAPDDEIIADELARASENIERRVRRREHTFTLASGPRDGEYARFGDALIAIISEVAPGVKLRQRYSEGSVDNAWLLARGEADYAIVQGDVAAAALAGEDIFARGGALGNLRAVGSLFPEAIHVAVLADSPIRSIAQLRGKRVDIGTPSSGTQFDAVAVLAAHGLKSEDLAETSTLGPAAAIAKLQRRHLDAVFMTAVAPARMLQQMAVKPGLRLLPISGPAVERLVQARAGLSPLTLPPNTYPQQKEGVTTVASSALLLTTLDTPNGEVARVADVVFSRLPKQQGGGADVVKVSAVNERRGVTIPLHPGAEQRSPVGTIGSQESDAKRQK